MSQSQMQEITCPKCGKKQFFRVWDSINTMEDPPLKEAVRNDEAFSFHCGDCGASAVLHYNFIYHEPAEKLFIVCSADGSDYTAMKETLTAEDNAFKGYTKRIVLSHNAFKEKLLIFDAGFNDKIVEVMRAVFMPMWMLITRIRGLMKYFLPPTKRGSTDSFSCAMGRCWRR